jgi:hypothetical protein
MKDKGRKTKDKMKIEKDKICAKEENIKKEPRHWGS